MEKSEFRKICLGRKVYNRYLLSKKISNEIYNLAKNYKNILLFIPLKNETDIRGVINRLRREKKNIFVPFMQDLSFKMVKYQLPLKKKKFSIFEPVNKQQTLQKIDLAIVPIVGITLDFRRIGFGKGMYDRFFAKLKYKPKVIFLQLSPCISKENVADKFDIKADEYISFNIRRKNERFNNFSRFDIIRSRGLLYSEKNG
ncbi:5-formyltetrahydrofolate cyclo-ligase [Lebetimonas natsushimae]|uniref:5-formyltetrahydrofolate cyclo-ligase n=1 Tax=Lebetimonas natsushimae TaxID=1936991 RepID=A0A292YCP4_9BACT|nr:5-formyltetrahydrofolate cyclo-ligase [Lebetimonas natsushimae]GAX87130.1 5-formyltetrahydrofolate cyclo-ligase [Lebetimonas natsushimae]